MRDPLTLSSSGWCSICWPNLHDLSLLRASWLARERVIPVSCLCFLVLISPLAGVATPLDYHIPYDDLELIAADGVKVKAYLMKQRKELLDRNDSQAPNDLEGAAREKRTDDEVNCFTSVFMQ